MFQQEEEKEEISNTRTTSNSSMTATTTTTTTIVGKKLLPDFRPPRCVAQLRYEYYWAWATQYHYHSRILVSDARDAYFQSNPFANLTKSTTTTTTTKDNHNDDNNDMATTLHVYRDTDSVGTNTPETNWIRNIYNTTILNQVKNYPGLCSGTTLGGQPAMEMYSRAMVHENDVHGSQKSCAMDQGRHIVLVRLNKLQGAPNITKVVEYDMGEGEVYTLGIPLLKWKVQLQNWKGYNTTTQEILNNDGSPTPLVHMFDRSPILKEIINNRTRDALQEWNQTKMSLAK